MRTNANEQGTYTFPDGESHIGEWKNGLPNGLGIRTYPDGTVEKGMFENGKFLPGKKLIERVQNDLPKTLGVFFFTSSKKSIKRSHKHTVVVM